MKLKVIDYKPHPMDWHVCIDERGNQMKLDLLVSGDLDEGTRPESLVGKTVEIEGAHAYVSIAHGVRIAGEQA